MARIRQFRSFPNFIGHHLSLMWLEEVVERSKGFHCELLILRF
jgi:hypothetical protein